MQSIAVIYDHLLRPDTTGSYCLRALAELAKVFHYHPSQMSEVPRQGFDLYLFVDDGLDYPIPVDLRPQAFWAIDTHLNCDLACRRAQNVDYLFAAQKNGAQYLQRELNRQAEWLPLACDPFIHSRHTVEPSINLSFVGNNVGGERLRLLQLLQSEVIGVHVGRHYFEDMAAVYSASRIVFNRSVADDINMRVFEALCCGSLLITNDLSENGQSELFKDEIHLVTYGSDGELLEKVRHYLRDDDARLRIAGNGRREVLERHTYRHRLEKMLAETLGSSLSRSADGPRSSMLSQSADYYRHCRPDLLEHIPRDASVILDVGCGGGYLGESLKRRQTCVVYGIEINPAAAEMAKSRLDHVILGDVEASDLKLTEKSLDVIICGDVLEHLQRPQQLLRRLAGLLKPKGRLIASVPNVANHAILSGLLAGNWTYEAAGLLDETHLRFFTVREAEKLLYRAGLRLLQTDVVREPGSNLIDQIADDGNVHLNGMTLSNVPSSCVERLTAYQYLLVSEVDENRRTNYAVTSIVIVVNNQLEYTRLCLASIRMRTDEPYEVIVVDNGSTDGTDDYLRECKGVRCISNSSNRGFPIAANQGITAARGDFILLLNNDCIVTTGWLTRLLAAVNCDGENGLAGPCSNNVSGEQQVPVTYACLSDLDGFAWEWAKQHEARRVVTDRLVGFCLLFKREVIDRIGLLDERFGIGNFEDDDFCRRAISAGFTAVIAEDAFVHHFGGVTFRANRVDCAQLMHHNLLQYQQKWGENAEMKEDEASEDTIPVDASPLISRGQDGEASSPRARLSLCMIVRDSARTLGECLQGIRQWVDELIVVDTGSLDGTVEIAKAFGAKVFYFPWCDDFSAARNESLSRATGDWVFWMDSDDTIDFENGRKLRQLVDANHKPEVIAYVAQVHCPHDLTGDDFTAVDHVKLVRNISTIRFEGRIHEQILPSIARVGGEVAWTDIFVVHSGSDQSPAGQAKKLDRDLRLLRLEEMERPQHPFTLFNLGMTLLEMKDREMAADYLKRTLEVAGHQESHVPKAFSLLIQSLSDMGRAEEAWRYCEVALERYPDDPEILFRAGILAHHFGRKEDAERYYLRNVNRLPEVRFRSIDNGILGYKTRQNLACLYGESKRYQEAEREWRAVLKERPRHWAAWRGLIETMLKRDANEAARELLRVEGAASLPPVLRLLLEAGIEETAGDIAKSRQLIDAAVKQDPECFEARDALCRILFEFGTLSEAESALLSLVEQFPNHGSGHFNLGVIRMRQQRFDAAVEAFNESLAKRPSWPLTYEYLAECYAQLGRDGEARYARAKASGTIATSSAYGTNSAAVGDNAFASAQTLREAVGTCLASAAKERSRLTPHVLAVPGMTSARIRHLLNRLGGLPGCRFLEVGTWYGATVISASFNNLGTYISVDDFSQFNQPDPRPLLHANLSRFANYCRVEIIEDDHLRASLQMPENSINVFFYDGAHTFDAHYQSLINYARVVRDPFVMVVDDWNLASARHGTYSALKQLGWTLVEKWERYTESNGDDTTWWNGLFVAVVAKSAVSIDDEPRNVQPELAVV